MSPQPGSPPTPRAGRAADDAETLLAAARAVLAGDTSIPPARWTRSAALLARRALEALVTAAIADYASRLAAQPVGGSATMRSKLVCLRVAGGSTAAAQAEWAWSALSAACHHHAYQLSPIAAEVAHLIQLVESVRTDLQADEAATADSSFNPDAWQSPGSYPMSQQ
jgi:hypothetical protein